MGNAFDRTVTSGFRAVKGTSVSSMIISGQIADDSCHWLLMTFIIKISYGKKQKNKRRGGKKSQKMMNGPFIAKADIETSRLLCVDIAFQESL